MSKLFVKVLTSVDVEIVSGGIIINGACRPLLQPGIALSDTYRDFLIKGPIRFQLSTRENLKLDIDLEEHDSDDNTLPVLPSNATLGC